MKKKRKIRLSLGKISVVFVVVALSSIAFNQALANRGEKTTISLLNNSQDGNRLVADPRIPNPQTSDNPKKLIVPNGWEIYTDIEYGVSISYPSEWVFEEASAGEQEGDPIKSVIFRPRQIPVSLANIQSTDEERRNKSIVAVMQIHAKPSDEVLETTCGYEVSCDKKENFDTGNISGVRIDGWSQAWDSVNEKPASEATILLIIPLGQNTLTFHYQPTPLYVNEDYSLLFPEIMNSISFQ